MNRDLTTIDTGQEEEILDNLYDRLGIASNATVAQIKKAYRELSLFYHPDNQRTGSKRMFESIKDAYDVLINPQQRAKYDEDGVVEKARLDDPIEVEAREQVAVILQRIITEEEMPDYNNVLDKLQNVWAHQRKAFADRELEFVKQESRIKAIRKRMKRKKKDKQKRSAIILMMLDGYIKAVGLGRERLEHDRKVFAAVVEIFDEYDYKVDQPDYSRMSGQAEFDQFRESMGNGRPGTTFFANRRPTGF